MHLHPLLPLAVVPLLLAGCHPKPDAAAAPYNVRYVVARATAATAGEPGPSFLGVIRGDTETNLSFKVNGQLSHIGPEGGTEDWRQGETVAAGAVLAQVDTANFVNAVAAARARAELARANFTRNRELYAAANLSQSEYDATRAQRDMAEADLAQAEQYLRDTTLRAPYEGVVLVRLARSGEFAAAGRPVLVLGDFRRVSLEVGVPDSVLGRIEVGQSCEVLVSAYEGGRFTGTISEIGIAADPTSRLFRVVLKIDNAAARLKSGMTASVHLGGRVAPTQSGIWLPLSALVGGGANSAGTAVFIVGDDGRVHLRPLRTAEIVASSILVVDGLHIGDKVVTLGAGLLTDGMSVNAQPVAQ
ncbi:MAG TPA: efflux RND transporter periplasmic adaptor subunit [Opitutaceae bacterium]|nr:efflux RND transporter periplasmic adaptor subunit [Opitutaceae bacterium]